MKVQTTVILLGLFFILARPVAAEYVLPYPSYMPGNKLYRVSRVMDQARLLWSFGAISQVKAHMALADKYFVEAKTLFEYKQYLLGSEALARSNSNLKEVPQYIVQGAAQRKDMTAYQSMYREDLALQNKQLNALLQTLPEEFLWTPENVDATHLPLRDMVRNAIAQRTELIGL